MSNRLADLARAAEDAGNHAEAYGYWKQVLEADPSNHEAWFGKAVAAGWDSDLRRDRLAEMTAGIEQAIARAPDADRAAVKVRAANAVASVVLAYFKLSANHTKEFITVDSAWPEHVQRCLAMTAAMQKATTWTATKPLLEGTLAVVDSLLKGVEYPKGEFSEGYEYLNVPDSMRPKLEALRTELIAKIQGIDPSFQAAEVKPASGPGCGCYIGVILIALVALFAIVMLLAKLSKG
jgi:tetratricopeptide (TPR) repeat protein